MIEVQAPARLNPRAGSFFSEVPELPFFPEFKNLGRTCLDEWRIAHVLARPIALHRARGHSVEHSLAMDAEQLPCCIVWIHPGGDCDDCVEAIAAIVVA
jgi:hypothetical protein